jgi:acetolactate synthase-1/2/3 large subunit
MMDFASWMAGFRDGGGSLGFGIPGGGASLQVADALQGAGGRFVVTGHEQTAALMAGGAFAVSGKPALCTTIKGPGFANLFPGLQCNAYEGFAHLALCEAYPSPNESARRHKWMNHARLSEASALRHGAFEGGREGFARAWQHACREAPGPVLLDLAKGPPLRDEMEDASATPSSPGLHAAMRRIASASRPLVIAGALTRRAAWGSQLQQLRVPVFTTPAAKGVIDESTVFAAGVFTGAGTNHTPEAALLPQADLIVLLGVRHGELLGPVPHASTLWLDAAAVAHVFPPEPRLDPPVVQMHANDFRAVLNALAEKRWGEGEVREAVQALRSSLDGLGWTPAAVAAVFAAEDGKTAHVLDTGNFTVLAEHGLPAGARTLVTGTPNSRWMGAGVGLALGAAFSVANGQAARDEVVLWIGDGGIRSLGFELRLAVEARLPLLVLIMADGYFGSVRGRVKNSGLREGTLRLSPLDIRATYEAMGLRCQTARSAEEVRETLGAWRSQGRAPTIIACEFDAAAYEQAGNLLR